MMDDSNDTEEDLYEGGYSDEEDLDSDQKEDDAQYMVIRTTRTELTIVTNYWRQAPC